jgi:hypothetical protein
LDHGRRVWQTIAIKLIALIAFCGGPLFVADLLKPVLGQNQAFLAAFAPLGTAIICAFSLWEDHPWSWGKPAVAVGLLGATLVAAMSVFALCRLAGDQDRPDRGLMLLGSVVGLLATAAYARLAWRRLGPSSR